LNSILSRPVHPVSRPTASSTPGLCPRTNTGPGRGNGTARQSLLILERASLRRLRSFARVSRCREAVWHEPSLHDTGGSFNTKQCLLHCASATVHVPVSQFS
jgi:hypothetical protein